MKMVETVRHAEVRVTYSWSASDAGVVVGWVLV